MTIFYDYILDELRLKDVPDGSGGFWGAFHDTTTQTIASTTTAYPITLNTTDGSNGVRIGSPTSRVYFDYDGVYSITFSLQYNSSDSSIHASRVWLRKNGTDIADSGSETDVPSKHGAINGGIVTTVNFTLQLVAGDYLEVCWQGESTNLSLETLPVGTTPTTPKSPSFIFTAVQGGIITQGSTANSLASLTDVSFTSLASGQIIMSNASGNWSNLTFPAIPSIPSLGSLAVLNTLDYSALTGKPSLGSLAVLNSLSYASLTNLPSLGSLAVLNSLSYTSLLNLPSLGSLAILNSLSYTSLLNQPSLSSLAFQSTVDYVTQVTSKPSLGSLAVLNSLSFTSLLNQPSLSSLAFQSTIDYTSAQLTNKPSLGSLAVLNSLTATDVGLGNVTNDAQLKIASNLSDLNNVTTARGNLSLGSMAVSNTINGFLPSTVSFNLLYTNGISNNSTISTNLLYANKIFASTISVGNITGNNGAFASTVSTNLLYTNGIFNKSTVSTDLIRTNAITASLASVGILSFASLNGPIYHNSLTSIQVSTTVSGVYHLNQYEYDYLLSISGTNTGDQVLPIYGDGADGTVSFDGSSTYSFASNDGAGTYTLLRDVYSDFININLGITVKTGGYKLCSNSWLYNYGTIHNNGSDGSGTTAGAGGLGGFYKAGGTGATGLLAASAGANGTAQATPTANTWVGGLGGRGGQGRLNTTSFVGGMITTANITTPANADGGSKVTSNFVNYLTRYVVGATNWQMTPSIGGGSGAKSIIGTTATSGGGGGGGGICFVAAPIILGAGTITANGGAGGNAAGTGGSFGGGGGGGGGIVVVVARSNDNNYYANGGAGGLSVIGTNGTFPVASANGTNTTLTQTLTLTPTVALSKGKLYLITFHLQNAAGISGSGINSISGWGISWNNFSGSRVEYNTIAAPTRVQETWYGYYENGSPDIVESEDIVVSLSNLNTTARVIIDEITNVDANNSNYPLTGNYATNSVNSATTLTVTLPTAPAAGNLVYSVFTRSAGTVPVAGAGNTLVNNQTTAPQITSQVSSAQQANIQTHTTAAAVAGFSVAIAAAITFYNASDGWAGKVVRIYG